MQSEWAFKALLVIKMATDWWVNLATSSHDFNSDEADGYVKVLVEHSRNIFNWTTAEAYLGTYLGWRGNVLNCFQVRYDSRVIIYDLYKIDHWQIVLKVLFHGPWWWLSSGQGARLLLWRSEFESRWSLQVFFKVVFEKNKNKEKEAGYDPLKIPFPLARVISFFSFHISYWP